MQNRDRDPFVPVVDSLPVPERVSEKRNRRKKKIPKKRRRRGHRNRKKEDEEGEVVIDDDDDDDDEEIPGVDRVQEKEMKKEGKDGQEEDERDKNISDLVNHSLKNQFFLVEYTFSQVWDAERALLKGESSPELFDHIRRSLRLAERSPVSASVMPPHRLKEREAAEAEETTTTTKTSTLTTKPSTPAATTRKNNKEGNKVKVDVVDPGMAVDLDGGGGGNDYEEEDSRQLAR